MRRALTLARYSPPTLPNPRVGAVLVHHNRIIGEGYHKGPGTPHAEVVAIHSALESSPQLIEESQLYVTLEPCNHHGKTPPCTNLILHHNIPKVFIGCLDPNPHVKGHGLHTLQENNVECNVGLLQQECQRLIDDFVVTLSNERPYVLIKYAVSKEGFFAPAQGQQWLSGRPSKVMTHKWRSEFDAIMVGTNTALIDNPQLTSRLYPGRNPIRIILDRHGRLPSKLHIFADGHPTWIVTPMESYPRSVSKTIVVDQASWSMPEILRRIRQEGIHSIIIEGGSKLIQDITRQSLWDECRIFSTPTSMPHGISAPSFPKKRIQRITVGYDILEVYRPD